MDKQKKRALRWLYKKVDAMRDMGLRSWWIALLREAAQKTAANTSRENPLQPSIKPPQRK